MGSRTFNRSNDQNPRARADQASREQAERLASLRAEAARVAATLEAQLPHPAASLILPAAAFAVLAAGLAPADGRVLAEARVRAAMLTLEASGAWEQARELIRDCVVSGARFDLWIGGLKLLGELGRGELALTASPRMLHWIERRYGEVVSSAVDRSSSFSGAAFFDHDHLFTDERSNP